MRTRKANTTGEKAVSSTPTKKGGRTPPVKATTSGKSQAKEPEVKSEVPSIDTATEAKPEVQQSGTSPKSMDKGKKDETTAVAVKGEDGNSTPSKPPTETAVAKKIKKTSTPKPTTGDEKSGVESAKKATSSKDEVISKSDDQLRDSTTTVTTTEVEKVKQEDIVDCNEKAKENVEEMVVEDSDVDEDELIEFEEVEEEDVEGGGGEGDEVEAETEDGEEEEEEEEEGGEEGEEEDQPSEVQEHRPVTEKMTRRKLEVFVGGLNRDAMEEDIKKALRHAGEIVEVRLSKVPRTNRNKGYAFVRFAKYEQAAAAAALGRVQIIGKSCAVVPSEDDDTLYLGNINKSWNKDQVSEKLKEYGVEGVDEINLVKDPHNADMNLGIAYLEFSAHEDAVKAHKRLSRRDAMFGSDKSASIAWATNPSDPREEVMAKVKSVFIDGLPSSWSEEKAREHFSKYGRIERVVFSRNLVSSKGKDFAFIHYSTPEGAVACVDAFKNVEHLVDGERKVKVVVQLSKSATKGKSIKRSSHGGFSVSRRPVGKISRRDDVWEHRHERVSVRRPPPRRSLESARESSSWAMRRSLKRVHDDYPPPVRVVKPRAIDDDRYFGRERIRERLPEVRGEYSRREEFHYERSRPVRDYSPPPRALPPRRTASRDDYRMRDYAEPLPSRRPSHHPSGGRYASPVAVRGDGFSRTADRGPLYEQERSSGYGRAHAHDVAELHGGLKRPYSSTMGDDAAYYEMGGGRGGYSSGRSDYLNPLPPYAEPYRGSTQGRTSAGSGLTMEGTVYESLQPSAAAGGGSLYRSGLGETGDYTSSEMRGSSLRSSSMYGGRLGGSSGYNVSGSSAYY